jgi:ankyrin repeat protein
MYGHANIVTELVSAKDVNINILTIDGFTPLMIAATEGKVSVVKALLKAGADIEIKDTKALKTAWDHASGHEDVLKEFVAWSSAKAKKEL